MFDCFFKKEQAPPSSKFCELLPNFFSHKSLSILDLTIGNFCGVKINVFLALSYMLCEVTIDIKFVFSKFDVTPSKNKGVTSNTQKITRRLVQEGVPAPCQTPTRQKTAHL